MPGKLLASYHGLSLPWPAGKLGSMDKVVSDLLYLLLPRDPINPSARQILRQLFKMIQPIISLTLDGI
jgi:hypothetical protein